MRPRATAATNTPSITPTMMPTVDNDELVGVHAVGINVEVTFLADVVSDEEVTGSVAADIDDFPVNLSVGSVATGVPALLELPAVAVVAPLQNTLQHMADSAVS